MKVASTASTIGDVAESPAAAQLDQRTQGQGGEGRHDMASAMDQLGGSPGAPKPGGERMAGHRQQHQADEAQPRPTLTAKIGVAADPGLGRPPNGRLGEAGIADRHWRPGPGTGTSWNRPVSAGEISRAVVAARKTRSTLWTPPPSSTCETQRWVSGPERLELTWLRATAATFARTGSGRHLSFRELSAVREAERRTGAADVVGQDLAADRR